MTARQQRAFILLGAKYARLNACASHGVKFKEPGMGNNMKNMVYQILVPLVTHIVSENLLQSTKTNEYDEI